MATRDSRIGDFRIVRKLHSARLKSKRIERAFKWNECEHFDNRVLRIYLLIVRIIKCIVSSVISDCDFLINI